MLKFFARTPMPLITATAEVSLAPIVQAAQRSTPTNDIPYSSFENVFAAPEPSSPLVDWMLSGRLGDCLEWFGEAGASLGREFIPQQSIVEHKEQLKYYAAKLTDALIEGPFNEEYSERDTVFEMSDLLHYVYHAKQLLQKTDGDMAEEINEQLGIFCLLAKYHSEAMARHFQELRKSLMQRYAGESDILLTPFFDEVKPEAKRTIAKRAIFSGGQKSKISNANEVGRVLRQTSSNSALSISLSSLNGGNGFALTGEAVGDGAGGAVSGAGDVNGDGIDDVVIGAPGARVNGGEYVGKSYVVFGRVSGFDTAMLLSSLNGENGFVLIGEGTLDEAGASVSGAGDVNEDGIDDVVIGVPGATINGELYVGKSCVIFGRVSGFDKEILLSNLNGTDGFCLMGETSNDHLGLSVSGAGDVNGDGIDDVLIAAPFANNYTGISYVVFGRVSGFPAMMPLVDLNGTNGFALTGEAHGDWSGSSVSSAGDVNGDGIDDVVIGAPRADIYGGKSYVVFGRTNGFDANMLFSSLDGTNGFTLMGGAGDWSGSSVSGAGDVNGDGIADVLIGAPFASKSYVVFGRVSGWNKTMSLANLDGTNGFALRGEAPGDGSGWSVSDAGDVNGDSIADIVIGTPIADSYTGKSYVVFGRKFESEFDAELPLASLNGTNGFVLTAETAGDWSGSSVSSAGDVNGDGIADVLIGAFGADDGTGKSYVAFGGLIQISVPPAPVPTPSLAPTPNPSGFSQIDYLSSLDKESGMVFTGEASYDSSGWSVSNAGDVNGDKVDDVIIGAPYADSTGKRSGKSYVIFGNSSNPVPFLNVSNFNGANGFLITGESGYDYAGWSVSTAGDVNVDGMSDVIIGAFRASSNSTRAGKGYVIFGKVSGFSSVLNLSSLNGTNGFMLTGEAAFDGLGFSLSRAGDVNGDKIDDVIIGAPFASLKRLNSGKSYVLFGKPSGFDSVLNVSSLNGTNGFVLTGEAMGDRVGYAVSGAGDVNGDGIDDVIIGAPYAIDTITGLATGKTYIVFGKKFSSFAPSLPLSSLNGKNGFLITGVANGDYFGFSVSNAGDVNGDKVDDIIIGAPRAGFAGSMAGKSYVIFGQTSGFVPVFNLANLDGNNGFVIAGAAAGDALGYSVKGAGDVDGDGFSDVIIGAPYATTNSTKSGKCYVIYGSASKFPAAIDLSLSNINGIVFIGEANGDRAGWSVNGAGDFNGDGIGDVIIGAPRADADSTGKISVGKSYVVFGVPAPPSPPASSPLSSGDIAGIAVGTAAGLALVAAIAKFGIWDRIISPPSAPERPQAIMP